ncbi:oligosaccharide flippase family protein [Limosilactobacillus fermentum]|uniref:lipopolysaccharide biosynthesis protein n=1 Tax=Limosilactobacillus fermentum TaxID=1613 RepID=UPI002103A3B0|nr:oligosaccharide flippase family protein [Limosilactobacillus fermentum]
MEENNFLKNIAQVMFGNAALLLSQVLTGFVLPKLMSVESFGNYRIFMLYGTYAGLLHFGFVDGILFKYGGKNIDDIKREEISKYYSVFIVIEAITSMVIIAISVLFFSGSKYGFIFFAIGIYNFVLNVVTFFQYFSQAIMRFGLVSSASLIQAATISVIIISILISKLIGFSKGVNYRTYVVMYIGVYCVLLVFYTLGYKQSNQYNKISITSKYGTNGINEVFKVGLPITIAYQISNLTLNLDNQFVSMFFSARTFAKYSFAYNLISITVSVVLAVATVLFPYLNKLGKAAALKQYINNIDYILLFAYASLISYYPVRIIIQWLLPKYQESLVYFRILSPGVAITLCITVIVSNYYKVMDDNIRYLRNGCISLVITLILDTVVYFTFKDVIAMAFVSLVELAIWYTIEDVSFRIKYNIKNFSSYLYIGLMVVAFEVATGMQNVLLSFIIYVCLYIVVSLLVMRRSMKVLSQKLINIVRY